MCTSVNIVQVYVLRLEKFLINLWLKRNIPQGRVQCLPLSWEIGQIKACYSRHDFPGKIISLIWKESKSNTHKTLHEYYSMSQDIKIIMQIHKHCYFINVYIFSIVYNERIQLCWIVY